MFKLMGTGETWLSKGTGCNNDRNGNSQFNPAWGNYSRRGGRLFVGCADEDDFACRSVPPLQCLEAIGAGRRVNENRFPIPCFARVGGVRKLPLIGLRS